MIVDLLGGMDNQLVNLNRQRHSPRRMQKRELSSRTGSWSRGGSPVKDAITRANFHNHQKHLSFPRHVRLHILLIQPHTNNPREAEIPPFSQIRAPGFHAERTGRRRWEAGIAQGLTQSSPYTILFVATRARPDSASPEWEGPYESSSGPTVSRHALIARPTPVAGNAGGIRLKAQILPDELGRNHAPLHRSVATGSEYGSGYCLANAANLVHSDRFRWFPTDNR